MKLDEITYTTYSHEWDEAIKEQFFKKLRYARTSFNKARHCVDKARNLALTKDPYKIEEAIKLLDYALEHFSEDNHSRTRSYQMKGVISERFLRDYYKAYECYTQWAELGTNHVGHDFDRMRTWLRATKLRPSEQLFSLLKNLGQSHLPTKEVRFWVAAAAAVAASHEGDTETQLRLAKLALDVVSEGDPSLLNQMLKHRVPLPDSLDVTIDELQIVQQLAGVADNR